MNSPPKTHVRAWAPGRVNLMGDHTDYTGGLALPVGIELGTTVVATRGGDLIRLQSDAAELPADVALDVDDPALVEPRWARYVAAVAAEMARRGPLTGLVGEVRSTLPLAAGLSSSASLEVAVALALGASGDALELARLAQAAEQRASGVPCGLMDQWAATAAREGHALLMDFTELSVQPVRMPDDVRVVVVHSGQARSLDESPYRQRREQAEAAAAEIGSLRLAAQADTTALGPLLRRRAQHVISENTRVLHTAEALARGDLVAVGELMRQSHASLRDYFEVSTPALDALAEALNAEPGVYGARLTGGGFGGCVVALAEKDSLHTDGRTWQGHQAWVLRAAGAAQATEWAPGDS